ncbi:hypothetical protein [Streptomyces sp. NPDC046805]|uniref:hypothetical protein n=1 Tax=Streptomyces sp. NPDC046805 TaxID=3155134 RepID=UPI0033CA977D
MLALRLTRGAHPVVHLRRLLVAAAAAGTGFLLLSALGYAMGHPGDPAASGARLAWCAVPLAATVHFAVAVARTDPGTKPRRGLSAIGLGPGQLMAVSALTTALSCTLGSTVALLFFLHLRGDLTGLPFDGAAAGLLAADAPLPLAAAMTLLALVPGIASGTVALVLRPRDARPATSGARRAHRAFGAYGRGGQRETFGAYGRFGTRLRVRPAANGTAGKGTTTAVTLPDGDASDGTAPDDAEGTPEHAAPAGDWADACARPGDDTPAPRDAPAGLPWGVAVLAAGLAVEAYASRSVTEPVSVLPGELAGNPAGVLVGWTLTALGLVLAAPGLTHLCGRLLQSAHPSALRLLAGRVLMAEAARIGRPLGVVCAVASGAYAMIALYGGTAASFGPLTTLGVLLVAGCTVATLLMAAVATRQSRADTVAALRRLGAPAAVLRGAAALRAAALVALFAPLTLLIADLAALPLAG